MAMKMYFSFFKGETHCPALSLAPCTVPSLLGWGKKSQGPRLQHKQRESNCGQVRVLWMKCVHECFKRLKSVKDANLERLPKLWILSFPCHSYQLDDILNHGVQTKNKRLLVQGNDTRPQIRTSKNK